VQKKRKLWSAGGREELKQLELLPYAAARREQLLVTLDELNRRWHLNQQVEEEVKRRAAAVRLMTHPGVGPVTALAMAAMKTPA
jgi:transposase